MFQDFSVQSRPELGPPRLAALREAMSAAGLDGFIIPRADAHQGEYVAPCDARLGWLTGFTGSAGFCIALPEIAGVFVDGRYRVQVRAEVSLDHFTPVNWPEVKPADWLKENAHAGAKIGFDPWLHTKSEIAKIREGLEGTGIALIESENLVDRVWNDRPAPPAEPARIHPPEFAGETAAEKRARLAEALRDDDIAAAVLTLPDSICWLLNIRGSDIPRNPVVQSFAVLFDDGAVKLFADDAKFDADLCAHLGDGISILPPDSLTAALEAIEGPVLVDPDSAPLAVSLLLADHDTKIHEARDPCILPKARKNAAEVAGMEVAHLRDATAMVEFLSWLDTEAPKGKLTEIDVVTALEGFRRDTNALLDISFETICGAGGNGAIVHYRVNEDTNRPVKPGELLLVDSGGQYVDGTTDITRTVAVGDVPEDAKRPFTRVLQGMIALSRTRFPRSVAGAHLDALARAPLWAEGWDYDHGTGHGVGAALCVHEGPARISRVSTLPLEPGMILSNEPGYYREGAFGIRIENLILTEEAEAKGDNRDQLSFSTLTWVPIDRRLIDVDLLGPEERDWLNAYHAEVLERIAPKVSEGAKAWLQAACAPL
ncbi:X-Pro aminopeptidase [Thioclava sp. DLFJ5-1]|uniref:aminopeptidase P family protein n=1 Tax=Thioclava sp. DLFJ5-1 TaxID=1915314 RepID=UPI000998271F|nr:aminopeptidase P family protein [Thioclava sp. DLFJ5-1]OOY18740.1 X-Pro aminopeptidase [Thioclava sp. DLFJ5-1]